MMRIITGKFRGVRLDTLPGDETRPTSERVKEAVFSSIQFDITDRRVLDLFAGSGQLGLEALSRGSGDVTFVDASPDAVAIIKKNAEKCGVFPACRYAISDYRTYLRKCRGREPWDLIFIDPPYRLGCVPDALARILDAGCAAPGSLLVCESGESEIFGGNADLAARFEVVKAARYSITYITILRLLPEASR